MPGEHYSFLLPLSLHSRGITLLTSVKSSLFAGEGGRERSTGRSRAWEQKFEQISVKFTKLLRLREGMSFLYSSRTFCY